MQHVKRVKKVVEIAHSELARRYRIELAKGHYHPDASDHLVEDEAKEYVVKHLFWGFNEIKRVDPRKEEGDKYV